MKKLKNKRSIQNSIKQTVSKGDDISDQKPFGMFSNLTYLPCNIYLPLNQVYKFLFEEQRFSIKIIEKKRSLSILHVNNEFVFNPFMLKNGPLQLPTKYKVIKDPIYHDEALLLGDEMGKLIVHIPMTLIVTEFEGVDNAQNCKKARLALEAFIRNYQYVSDDTLTFTPTEMILNSFADYDCFHIYNEQERAQNEDQRFQLNFNRDYSLNNIDIKAYNMKKSGMDGKETTFDARLKLLLTAEKKNEFILSTMYKANSQLYPQRNYKYALLDYFFIIESVIFNYVTEKKIGLGISQNKLNNYKTQVTISYMINVDMPMLIQPFTAELKGLLDEIDRVRKIRNDIVHNQSMVTEEQAKKAKSAAYKLLKYLNIVVVSSEVPYDKIADFSGIEGLSLATEKPA